MKKKIVISIGVIFLVLIVMISIFLVIKKSNYNKNIEKIKGEITNFYNNITLSSSNNYATNLNKERYQQLLNEFYPLNDNEEMKTEAKNSMIDYYNNLDKKVKMKVDIKNVVINNNQARVTVNLTRSNCYDVNNYNELYEKNLDVNNNTLEYFNELENLTDKCLDNNKSNKKVMTVTLLKKDSKWLVNDFYSVVDNEVKKTKIGESNISKIKDYSNVYTTTKFRLLDFSLETKNDKLSYKNKFMINLKKNNSYNLKIEVSGNKGDKFNVVIYGQSKNVLLEKSLKLSSNHEVFELPFKFKEDNNMLQVYMYDENDFEKNTLIDNFAFGRIYIFNQE